MVKHIHVPIPNQRSESATSHVIKEGAVRTALTQQALGGLEICRVQTFRELLEHRPQKRPGSLASSLIRQ